ncbi:NEAT domain-containing protein [Paenibacillus sp. NPDC056722]|uniref:NEAT domain-containing protein n=1 Tax=Paenibacillus sp. NPDC056722 TaxID=3345924 RepID=UPI0036B5E25F
MNKARFGFVLRIMAFILLIGSVIQPLGGAYAESARYKDGQYVLPYSILKDGTTSPSVMEGFVLKPAALEVKDGKNYVSITVTQDKEITGLKLTAADGTLSEGTVTNKNASNNQRTVKFELGDLNSTIKGWVKIEWPEINYFNVYDVDFKFDPSQIPAAEPKPETPSDPVLNDGQYTIAYSVLQATGDTESSMNKYFSTPAVLTVDKGQKSISFSVIKDSSTIQEIQVAGDGTNLVPATTVSEDKAANTRVISFPVERLSAILPGTVRVVVASANYDKSHAVRYKFNLDSITAVSVGGEETPTSTPTPTPTPISTPAPGTEGGGDGGTAPVTSPSPVPTATPGSSIADGYYSIDYSILKDGSNEVSMMDTYVQHPGTLIVSGGQKYLAITLTQSKEITGFTVGQQSVSVIASDNAANTRTVQFPISNTGVRLKAWVKIDWPEFNYFHTYNVDIKVGNTVGGQTSNPAGQVDSGASSPAATPTPSATAVASATPTPKPTSTPVANGGTTGTEQAVPVSLTDVNGHWAQAAIEQAIKSGLVKGYDDNSFRPNNPINRAEFAVLLSRALKLEGGATDSSGFSDASSIPAWAADGVAQVAARKIISGYEDGSFRADRKITRAELAVIIVRAQGLKVDPTAVPTFSDIADIAAWARPYIAAAEQAGLISGKGGNRYAPGEYATRAEAVTLLVKLLEQ